jgi:hypothetical protein
MYKIAFTRKMAIGTYISSSEVDDKHPRTEIQTLTEDNKECPCTVQDEEPDDWFRSSGGGPYMASRVP